jgi:hypothetical protein
MRAAVARIGNRRIMISVSSTPGQIIDYIGYFVW